MKNIMDEDDMVEQLKIYQDLVSNLEGFNSLLGEEINHMLGFCYSHGWTSSRYEEGNEFRKKIQDLKDKLINI